MNAERTILRLVVWPAHRLAHRVSRGRLGSRQPGADDVGTLILVTTGRRTGEPRANPVYFTPRGEDYVLVASNAGHRTDPAWWLNLKANPVATVRLAGSERRVRARQALGGERDELWVELVRRYPRYALYAGRADRSIPVVVLEPI